MAEAVREKASKSKGKIQKSKEKTAGLEKARVEGDVSYVGIETGRKIITDLDKNVAAIGEDEKKKFRLRIWWIYFQNHQELILRQN